MNGIKRATKSFATAALLLGLVINFNACSKTSPLSPQNSDSQRNLSILKLGNSAAPMSLLKKSDKKKKIKKETGGEIVLMPGTDEELLALIYQRPPVSSGQLKSSLLAGSPLSAVILTEAINRRRPMRSKHLNEVLLANSPLNPTVLINAIESKRALTRRDLKKLLLENSPLRTSVLDALLSSKRLRSRDLKDVLIASSPLTQSILDKVTSRSSGLRRSDLKKVLNAQNIVTDRTVATEYKKNLGQLGVKIEFKVLPESITEDIEISISTDDEQLAGNIFLTFGPDGTTIDPPAVLDVEVSGLDLSNLQGDDDDDDDDDNHYRYGINIFYVNPDSDDWEVMESDKITVKKNQGYIKIKGAQLPHFSRYAIGME
jgi:hypothetical protein